MANNILTSANTLQYSCLYKLMHTIKGMGNGGFFRCTNRFTLNRFSAVYTWQFNLIHLREWFKRLHIKSLYSDIITKQFEASNLLEVASKAL